MLEVDGSEVLRGVKTFCSGAGGLDRALILARQAKGGPPLAVWIDLTDDRVRGRRHLVPVPRPARVGFTSRRVPRRAGARPVRRAGVAGRAAVVLPRRDSAPRRAGRAWPTPPPARRSTELAERPGRGELEALAAGRILTAQRTIDLWIDRGARAMDAGDGELTDIAVQARVGIFDACRALLDEAARACGSRPFARGRRPRPGAARPRGVPAPAPARPAARAPRRSGARGALT